MTRSMLAPRAAVIASASSAASPLDVLGAFLAPDAQRIEHRGDAAGRELRIVGHHRRHRVPVHLRPRHVVRFEVVGVKLDQAGNDEVARNIFGARRRWAAAEVGDHAVLRDDEAGLDHRVGEHQACIGKAKAAAMVRRRSG